MPHHCLPAGTDVAEMALFDVDAVPQSQPPDAEGLAELASQGRLVRLPTGGDGGYLLHLYVDESPPEEVMRYCQAEDKLAGQFTSSKGNIAFGGAESAFRDFKPNHYIRSDAKIPSGRYNFTAFHTDIPDEIIDQAIRVERSPTEVLLSRAPLAITLTSLGLAGASATFRQFVLAGIVLALGYLAFKVFKRLPAFKELAARREEAQLKFPSILIELRSNPTIEPTASGTLRVPTAAAHVER